MHHLILGYGYCGYYLAQEILNLNSAVKSTTSPDCTDLQGYFEDFLPHRMGDTISIKNLQNNLVNQHIRASRYNSTAEFRLKNQQKVTAISRHLNPNMELPGLNHITADLHEVFSWSDPDTIIYYLIPPPSQGESDIFLKQFLGHSLIKAKKFIYFGSSGVYGNQQGSWVNEESPCLIDNTRQLRRLDAEQQCLAYCKKHDIEPILLRIAGIYGPQRLPIVAARAKTPVIEIKKAPYTNHIFVKDLASIAFLLSQIKVSHALYNIADGHPKPMGTIQQLVAQTLGVMQAPSESWEQAWERASPIKKEFINGSKRLDINRLKKTLGSSLVLTDLSDAIKQSI